MKNEYNFQRPNYPPKTWEHSPQKPLFATLSLRVVKSGKSEVFFWPLLCTRCIFPQNYLTSQFVHYLGVNSFIPTGTKHFSPPTVFFRKFGDPSMGHVSYVGNCQLIFSDFGISVSKPVILAHSMCPHFLHAALPKYLAKGERTLEILSLNAYNSLLRSHQQAQIAGWLFWIWSWK